MEQETSYFEGFLLPIMVGLQKEGFLYFGYECCPLKELHIFP